MLISISMNKYLEPEDCKWYKFKGPNLKIESRKSEDILEKDDIIGIKENLKAKNKFFLVYPATLDRPIEVDAKFVKKLVAKSTELKKIPKEALEGERNIRSGKKSPLNDAAPDNIDLNISATPLDSDFFKPRGNIKAADEKKAIDFKNYQWRKVSRKYDVYKPNGSAIAMHLKVNDIIGVRFKHMARGGFIVNLRGSRHVISDPEDYKAVVDHSDIIEFNRWPKTIITAAQIAANQAEDDAETDRIHQKQVKEAKDKREAEAKEVKAINEAQAELERENKLADAEAKRIADEEFAKNSIIAKDKREAERKAMEAPAEEGEILKYIIDGSDNEDDVVDDDDEDDFDIDSLDGLDLEDDDDEPSILKPNMDNPELTSDPDVRPMNIEKNTADVAGSLKTTLDKLREESKGLDLDDEDADDLDEGDELEDEDEDDVEDYGDEDDEDEDDESEDDESEDDEEGDEEASPEEEKDEDDMEDAEAGEEDVEEDEGEEEGDEEGEDEDEMTVDEMRETLVDEGVIGENDDVSDKDIRAKFKASMEEAEEGEEDDEAYADEDEDDEDDSSGDLDDLDGPSDEDLDDDSDEETEDDGEGDDEDLGDEDEEEDTSANDYEPDEGDVVVFKSDKTKQQEHVILDISALPKNSNIMVVKVYNIEDEPEHYTNVKVSVEESKGFSKLVKFVRKMNGKEFMEYYIRTEDYEKSNEPIAS